MGNGVSLTVSQKVCLQLVSQGMTSKEIAAKTGLSPSTVDTYLKNATSTLGATNRRDAARRFRLIGDSQNLGSQSADVAFGNALSDDEVGPAVGGNPATAINSVMRLLKPPPIGGSENEFGVARRLFEVLRIACLMSVILAGLVLFALGAIEVLS